MKQSRAQKFLASTLLIEIKPVRTKQGLEDSSERVRMNHAYLSRRHIAVAPLALMLVRPGSALAASTEDLTAAQHRVRAIVGRVFARLAELGVDARPPPHVQIAYTPARTAFDPAKRVIVAPAWSQAPASLHAQVEGWAHASGGELDARTLFGEIYNGFMIAHEAFHAYQSDLGFWRPEADLYESEIVANRGAVAFALESREGKAHITRIMRLAQAALAATPRPIPPDIDERTYFNANAGMIQTDPVRHGWFEAQMMLRAWAKRHEMDFAIMTVRLKQAADKVRQREA